MYGNLMTPEEHQYAMCVKDETANITFTLLSTSTSTLTYVSEFFDSIMLETYTLIYYTYTDEIRGFLLSVKSHIFAARSKDTIIMFHM